MGLQTFLPNSATALVLDTSVVINLNASGIAEDIVRAIPTPVVVENVYDELSSGGEKGQIVASLLKNLGSRQLVQLKCLGDGELATFERLVSGHAEDTLDDGEAATLAYAYHRGAIAVIDESKARRICANRLAPLTPLCSVELFQLAEKSCHMKRERLSDALHSALMEARMNVFPRDLPWVLGLIGTERAKLCKSLPRSYRAHCR